MSEYQYYEFQAVDRPLTERAMKELRALSTRARITPTQLQNTYHFGDFKGDPLVLMERYFDAFVYVANWGTRRFMLRLPRPLLDPEVARPYAVDGALDLHARADVVVLDFSAEDEEGGRWIEDDEAAAWMPALLPLRAELAGGDRRALYLGWLAAVTADLLDDDDPEPPMPAGLGSLSASLSTFVDFLRIDQDLLAGAAARSPALAPEAKPGDLARWIGLLPVADKDDLLLRLATDDAPHVRAELLQRFRRAQPQPATADLGRLTVADLRAAAEARAAERDRREAARRAAEQARQERERAAARATYLDGLVGREEGLWRQIEALVETKRPQDYDHAVRLLVDLRDVGVRRHGDPATFGSRLGSLRGRYARRPSFIERLDRAGLQG